MRKAKVVLHIGPKKGCINCGRKKELHRSYYCEACRETLLKKKLSEV